MKTYALIAAGVALLASPVVAQQAAQPHGGAHAGHGTTATATPAQASGVVTIPADGAMLQGAPQAFTATFPHPMTLKSVSIAPARGEAIRVATPAAEAATRVSVPLPPLSAGSYTLTWVADGSGHEMTGTVRFMVH
ncbi:copper resistance protein CopC [Brevundimonas sp. S30B]|uniref:copper resistance CopC family protein n=1 Tax=unclassified Brevundimonas TaxID=2622653 RepID=UPI0010722E40|nr:MULTISPECIES: copper resistance protein CopC [unclassified Brevundimonas]QBX37871.1 copper resistance protein CopC [Brevundimonas sp. MF30-B]TFW02773.1 copper resistance protein CopC [Brevundimonas sp. S30B]